MSENAFAYALMNPLATFLNKRPDEFQREDLIRVINQKQLERITFHYTALDGRLKELKLPVSSRSRAERILAEGERVDGSSLFPGMVETSVSDLYVVPEYRTAFFNPFDSGSLDFICRFLTKDGDRSDFVPDNILSRAINLFRKNTGLDLYALGELEFYIVSSRENNLYRPIKQQSYHESSPFFKKGDFLTEVLRHITQITDAVKYAHSEVGYLDRIESENMEIDGKQAEQMEVEFLPRPIEEMADALVIARWLIRNIAQKYGFVATFTPKLAQDVAGNGLHFHLQLRENGKNIMEGRDGRLSESALRLVGGLCFHADALTAFGNTMAASYLRLVPNQEAPTKIFWSGLNRSALIRVPLAWSNVQDIAKTINPQETSANGDYETSKTVELRSADGSALIHLILAGVTMAADWGFKELESLEIANNLYVKSSISSEAGVLDAFSSLPANCMESSKVLVEKRHLFERDNIFPPAIIDHVAAALRREKDEIIDLTKPEAVKKIMHQDIHRH